MAAHGVSPHRLVLGKMLPAAAHMRRAAAADLFLDTRGVQRPHLRRRRALGGARLGEGLLEGRSGGQKGRDLSDRRVDNASDSPSVMNAGWDSTLKGAIFKHHAQLACVPGRRVGMTVVREFPIRWPNSAGIKIEVSGPAES
jgi:hypothetical protein